MLKKRIEVATFNYDGLWLDIGRQDDYFKAIDMFKVNKKNFIK